MERTDIVAAARALVGTPFHHQGRVPGRAGGVDCIGLMVCVSRALGVEPHDFLTYTRQPDPQALMDHLRKGMNEIPMSQACAGSVLVLAWEVDPQHFVMLTEKDTIIHARERADGTGEVGETRMPADWRKCIHSAWDFKGVV